MSGLPSGAVTFLFTDIEGSTRLVKVLRERYAEVLAEHQRLIRAAVATYAGHEVDTQGDAFFAAFGGAKQAVLCALDIHRALAAQDWPEGVRVRVRIGIHTGQAVAAGGRYAGLAVHRAARICAVADGGQVLISQATQDLIEDEEEELGFALVDAGEHRLKDLDRPVRLFQLTAVGLDPPAADLASRATGAGVAGVRGQPPTLTSFIGRSEPVRDVAGPLGQLRLVTVTEPAGSGQTRLGKMQGWARPSLPVRLGSPDQQLPFVGRGDDLAVLEEAWAAVVAGAGRAVFVGGEPGAGKSRLVAEVARGFYGQQATVLLGSCVAELSTPYEPFDEPVRVLLPAIRRDQIPLEDWGAARDEMRLEFLSAVAGRVDVTPALAEAGHRRGVYDAVVAAFRGAADLAPLVLVLEDLHWAGTTAVELLGYLVERTAEARILVLATYRTSGPDRSGPLSEAIAGLYRLDGVRRLDLRPLTADDIAEYLVRQGPATDRHVRRAAALLRDQTGGNPFFLRELWRDLAGRGGLSGLRPGVLAAPQSVKDALEHRLRSLTAEHQEVIEFAAVIGEELDSAELLAVSGHPPATVLAALDAGADLGIIEQAAGADGCFRFPHAIARQVLLDRLSPSRLTMAHSRIAEELESNFPAAERRVQRLAHHFASARALGYVEQAVRYLVQAAEIADRSRAHADAAGLYQRAASAATLPQQRDDLRLQAARCYLLAADFGRARELSEQVIATGDPRQRLQAATLYETASVRPGREGHRAVEVLTEALRGIPRDPADALYVAGIASLGTAVAFTGASGQARSLGDDAIAMARSLGDRNLLASSLEASLFHPYRPADTAERLSRADELTQLAAQSGNAEHLGSATCFRAIACYIRGDAAGLDGCEADLAKVCQETGDFWAYFAGCIRYARQFAEGNLDEARQACSRLAESGSSFGTDDSEGPYGDTEGPYGVQMYLLQREAGRLEAVRPLITGEESPAQRWPPGLLALYTELGLERPAQRLLRWLLERYTDRDRDSGDWPIRLVFMAEAAIRLEDMAAARRLRPLMAEYAAFNLVGGHFVAVFGSADRYLGQLESLLGEGSPEDRFEAAVALDVRTRAPLHQAETLAAYAAHLRRAGKDMTRAQQLAEQALSIARPRGLRRITGILARHGAEGRHA
jgi:class 3 adenylate cyclase